MPGPKLRECNPKAADSEDSHAIIDVSKKDVTEKTSEPAWRVRKQTRAEKNEYNGAKSQHGPKPQ